MKNNLIKVEPSIYNIINTLNRLGHQSLIVGGCVRDAILGIDKPKDVDIEVYKICYEDLMKFLSKYGKVDLVGKNFGVIKFKPTNGIGIDYDFSIPRKENKIGVLHTDYEITFDVNFTIEESAIRRDFTMNALAYDPIEDQIYDYFGGLDDIKNKIIRHTSEKFSEDSLRILRAMNFSARFGFTIHPDTIALMKKMLTETNEFSLLPKERVFEEFYKWAERGTDHSLIFKFMRDTGLIEYYPSLKALKSTPQDPIWHPEGDCESHIYLCLKEIDRIIKENNITGTEKVILVVSTLFHDIAKPPTTKEELKHGRMCITSNGHEEMGGEMVKTILSNIGFHAELIEPISNLIANHLAGVKIEHIEALRGKTKFVKKLSRKLHPATIQQLLYIMEADTNGRGGLEYREPSGAKDIIEIASQVQVVEKQYEYILMGRHLIMAGLKPSNEFGVILGKANEAQENGEFSDVDGAKQWLGEYLKLEK